LCFYFFFSSRRRHTRSKRDWSSDVCSSDLLGLTNEKIAKALATASLTAMRMQPVVGTNGALFINDAYNAAPTSVNAALQFMKERSEERRVGKECRRRRWRYR